MYYLLTLIIVIFTSIAHILLKKGSVNLLKTQISMYLNPFSLVAYLIFSIVAFLSIYAMKGLELKDFFALNSLTYMVIPILSFLLLKESVTKNKIIGILLVSLGVVVFYF
jgi:small multidrug resistance pump